MPAKRAAKAGKVVKVGPSKDVVRLSEALEGMMLAEQLKQKEGEMPSVWRHPGAHAQPARADP